MPTINADATDAMARRVRSRNLAEQHFVAELTNSIPEMMASMTSRDPMLTAIVLEDGVQPAQLVLCPTVDEMTPFYTEARRAVHLTTDSIFTALGTDWYGLLHGILTAKILDTGATQDFEVVGLLPPSVGEETVCGEIGLARPTFAKVDDPGAVAYGRSDFLAVHPTWLSAARRGAASELAELYSEDCLLATRLPDDVSLRRVDGRTAIEEFYARLLRPVVDRQVDVALRIVDRWFMVTELLWTSSVHADAFRSVDITVLNERDEIATQIGLTARLGSDA